MIPGDQYVTEYLGGRLNPAKPLAEALQTAIIETLDKYPGGGWVDSHAIADRAFQFRRLNPDYKVSKVYAMPDGTTKTFRQQGAPDSSQTLDYVQHLFRELYHGCRYAHKGQYFIHTDRECGAVCRARRQRLKNATIRITPLCPSCYLRANTDGLCPSCEFPVSGNTLLTTGTVSTTITRWT